MKLAELLPTLREGAFLGVGLLGGLYIAKSTSRKSNVSIAPPTRLFKLCVAEELTAFEKLGYIQSSLDKTDGFVHLSDRTSPGKVAKLFFSKANDLYLLEIDASLLQSPVEWVVGVMGDPAPSVPANKTTIHYLVADGCVHVYGIVSVDAVVRKAHVPLGTNGLHQLPEWL